MKTVSVTMLVALMSVVASAQTNSCPLQPVLVKNLASQISVSLQNLGAKQVASYHIGLTFQDVNGGTHTFPQLLGDHIMLKSRSRRTAMWHSPDTLQFLFPLAKVYVLDATFTDGTEWSDDGSQSCSVTSVQE